MDYELIKKAHHAPFIDKFRYRDRTMIRNDWAAMLPGMAYRPKVNFIRFSRIIGPLVINICFKLSSIVGAKYKPEYGVHNLVCVKPATAMGISPMPGLTTPLSVHKELYLHVIKEMKEDAPLPLEGPMTLDDIFNGYKKAASRIGKNEDYDKALKRLTSQFEGNEQEARRVLEHGALSYHDASGPALVAVWAGEEEKAKEYWEWGLKAGGVYHAKYMTETYGPMLKDPDVLRKTARAERLRHCFDYAPYQDIVGVPYRETWTN